MRTTIFLGFTFFLNFTAAGQPTIELVKELDGYARLGRNAIANDTQLIFIVDNPGIPSIWKSDGSESGTQRIATVRSEYGFTPFLGKYYFSAEFPPVDRELWETDGTETGTKLVKEINPLGYDDPGDFHVLGDKLYFSANDGTHGYELWVTDGTGEGTKMVNNIDPSGMYPYLITVFKNKLYFNANDGVHGRELWTSDGTAAGTFMLKDISPDFGDLQHFFVYKEKLFFAANDTEHGFFELWVSDGTAEGTELFKDINPGDAVIAPQNYVVSNDKLFFMADDGVHGPEVWVSDGTPEGTHMIKDIDPTPDNPFYFYYYVSFQGKVFFRGPNHKLWTTDGTELGTYRVFEGLQPRYFRVLDDKLYFIGNLGADESKLWVTDGTTEGTNKVIWPEGVDTNEAIYDMTVFGNSLYFNANLGTSQALWRLVGSPFVNDPADQVVCNGSVTADVNFIGTGTDYDWVNSEPSIGLFGSGTGKIESFVAVNTGAAPVIATITVTPKRVAGSTTTGSPQTFTIRVNPLPNVSDPDDQVVCNGSMTVPVNFVGTATDYDWVNNDISVGLSGNGTGNIGSFMASAGGTSSVIATITVSPRYAAGIVCSGSAQTFTITGIPTPAVNNPGNQEVDNGSMTSTVTFTGTGATGYGWTNSDPSIGLAASGRGDIPAFTAVNNGSTTTVGTITVTPEHGLCAGMSQVFTIAVDAEEEPLNVSRVGFYPNPAGDYLYIIGLRGLPDVSQLTSFNGQTRALTLDRVNDGYRFSLADLMIGLYVLRIQEGGRTHQFKFIRK